MKKILLILVAFAATVGVFAQKAGKSAGYTPVTDAKELGGLRIASVADGSVYASSTYNKSFTFGGQTIAEPLDAMTSAVIVKYSADLEEQWAVTLEGNAVVTAMTTDEDGNLYAVGTMTDKVTFYGSEGSSDLTADDKNGSAFVLKVSADGKLLASKIITSQTNQEVAVSEFPFYLPDDMSPIYVTPTKVQVSGDKVYVAANYLGDVAELGWAGRYIAYYDFGMYLDDKSTGVFSLNKDLKEASNVACVQGEQFGGTQAYPEALSFVVDNGTVYIGFFGFGDLTVASASESKDLKFESGKHPFTLATIKDGTITTMTYDAPAHCKDAKPYYIDMNLSADNIIVSGTYYGALPFDNSKTSGKTSEANGETAYEFTSEAFVASLSKSGLVNWAAVPGKESVGKKSVIALGQVFVATNQGVFLVEESTGNVMSLDAEGSQVADCSYNGLYFTSIVASDTDVKIIAGELDPVSVDDVRPLSRTSAPTGLYMDDGKIVIVKKDKNRYSTSGALIP